ncbi:FimV/HubP family polar landmark protein [Azonexus sp. IMCC34839]|uniref:FimV/HubP family polar landmark protein n=1 Tax=Azonexus sp. IMCC34839 TaxID=3133695 RepID=UPI00399BD1BE
MSFLPFAADAAGLGKLNVLSGLGQPLRAEVEIGAAKEELSGMTARLAPQEAFKQAGVDFSSVLLDLRFAVDKRPNGQSVIKVTSSRPINEPFMDFLIELNWTNGRLVREYTFLLDPPADVAAKPMGRQTAEAKVVEVVSAPAAKAEGKSPAPRVATPTKPAAEPAKKAATPAENADAHVVKQGETLRKIAADSKYEGVSLEQMLVGLFKNNPDAFVGNNVNRLKAGAILNIPEKSAVEAVTEAEAKKIYTAHAGDWNSYRQKLASATAKEAAKDDAAGQVSSGKITAKVEEKAAPADQVRDQVKVARTDTPAKGGKAAPAADDAERVAKEKALKEAQDRVALLEKNVGELQKLLELKSQKLAEVQQAQVKKEEAKPVESVKPVEAPKPVEPPKVESVAKTQEEARPVAAEKPAEPAKAPEEVKPVEAAPPPPPAPAPAPKKPAPPPPPPPPEPSLVDALLEDPLPLAAGGGLLALLAGFFLVKRRRSGSSSAETTAVPAPSSLGPNSVFRMTGGQSVDTGNTPPQTGDFSQTGPGAIDTDEVDPVAEADVYMAYGRDTQAEEILLEALQKDPQRTAIHAKLLEIYANRGSVKQFETLASELYAQTGGVGSEWQKVAALGARLDPANPLYSGSATQAEVPAAEVAPVIPDVKATLAMPGALSQMAEAALELPAEEPLVAPEAPLAASEPAPAEFEAAPANEEMVGLDFDLGSPEVPVAVEENVAAPEISGSDALDFDLGSEFAAAVPSSVPEEVPSFELPPATVEELEAEPAFASAPDFSPEGTLVVSPAAGDDVDIGVSTFVGLESPEQESGKAEEPAELESVVDFDLDLGNAGTATVVSNDFAADSGTATLVNSSAFSSALEVDNPKLAETMVNTGAPDDSLEFDVKLTDSVFLGQPMASDFDIGSINLDLSAEPSPAPAAAEAPVESEGAAVQHDAHWEEVNTKLDLAKAYEEMGDLEGARELLQEVVGEGSADLVEQAQSILARIGG